MKKAALVLALFALAWGPPPPKVVKCTMSVDGLLDIFMTGKTYRIVYPTVLVFDRNGGLVSTSVGLASAESIQRLSQRHARKDAARLESFAGAYLRGDDGKPLDPATLAGTPTVIEIGAPWCKPCHALEAELRRVPGITLVLADGDTQKRQDELKAALQKRLNK